MRDAVTHVAAEDFNSPQPDDVAEELGEVLREGLVPGCRDGAHQRHEDDVEGHVDEDAEGGTLPELDLGEALGQQAVDEREADREREVDDEGDPGESFVTVEGVGQVGDALRDAQLLEQFLGRVGGVALGRTRRQRHLPAELHDGGDDAAENTCDCCDAVAAALGIGLNQCHVTSMKRALGIFEALGCLALKVTRGCDQGKWAKNSQVG